MTPPNGLVPPSSRTGFAGTPSTRFAFSPRPPPSYRMRRLQAAAGLATCASGMVTSSTRASEATEGLRRFPSDPAPPSATEARELVKDWTSQEASPGYFPPDNSWPWPPENGNPRAAIPALREALSTHSGSSSEDKALLAGQRQAADWPRLATTRGNLEHELPPSLIAASGEPAGRGLSRLLLHTSPSFPHLGAAPPLRASATR